MERISRWRQVVYSTGNGGFSIFDNIFGLYFMYMLLPPKETGMPELIHNKSLFWDNSGITVIGLIIIFGRIIDSIADPLIANWSDRNKSSLGRRRFFLLTGALPFALFSVLLFMQPDQYPSLLNVFYTAFVLGAYFFFYTYYMAPYLALIPELTYSHKERIFVTILQAIFMLIGAAIIMMGVPQLWAGMKGVIPDKKNAFILAIIIVAVFGMVVAFIAGYVIDEKKYAKGEPADIPLIQSIKMTLGNKAFITYMIPVILYWFAFHMIRTIIAYYPMVLLKQKNDEYQTVLMVLLFGGAIVFFLLIFMLSKKVSNKTIMSSGLLSFAMFMVITYFIDVFGDNAKLVANIQMFLLGYPVAVLMVIPNAIVADISEVDGHLNGTHREAMFFGTQGLFMKVNYGLASAIVAGLFSAFGKDVANPLGVKLTGPVASGFALAGFLIFFLYPQKWVTDILKTIRKDEES